MVFRVIDGLKIGRSAGQAGCSVLQDCGLGGRMGNLVKEDYSIRVDFFQIRDV